MILIALLIALSVERVASLPVFWQMDFLLTRWLDWSQSKLPTRYQQQLNLGWAQALWLLLPAVLAGLLVGWLDNGVVTFIASIIALIVAMACPEARQAYKRYLTAANRADEAEVSTQQQILQQLAGNRDNRPVNETVCWLNYQYYVAVIFFFVLFGVFGALGYASIRSADNHDNQRLDALPLTKLRWFLDFIPVRLTGLGLLIVGHFSRALPAWLNALTDTARCHRDILADIVNKAEDTPHHPDDKTEAVGAQLTLMKRQQLVWLCVVALLTLTGALH